MDFSHLDDPAPPAPRAALDAVLRRGQRIRARRVVTGALATMVALSIGTGGLAARGGAGGDTRVQVAGPDRRSSSTPPPAGPATTGVDRKHVRVRLEPDAPSVRSGGELGATIVFDNRTGKPVEVTGCGRFYSVVLASRHAPAAVARYDCAQRFQISPGVTRERVRLAAYTIAWQGRGPARALPPGDYYARVVLARPSPLVILPAPVPVRVTTVSRASVRPARPSPAVPGATAIPVGGTVPATSTTGPDTSVPDVPGSTLPTVPPITLPPITLPPISLPPPAP